MLNRLSSAVEVIVQLALQWTDDIITPRLGADEHPSIQHRQLYQGQFTAVL